MLRKGNCKGLIYKFAICHAYYLKGPEFRGMYIILSAHIHSSRLRGFNLIHLIKPSKLICIFEGHPDGAAQVVNIRSRASEKVSSELWCQVY